MAVTIDLAKALDKAYEDKSLKDILDASPSALAGVTEDDAAAVEKQFTEAVAGDGVLALTDTKGRRVIVPADRISYVEIGSGSTGHVGFRS